MRWCGMTIRIVRGDITRLDVDAIVNAANRSLLGGGGVDGAIHRAAGKGLLAECRALGGCPTGEARMTAGHDLAARHVIHAVGPRWKGGHRSEASLLASAYRNSLTQAAAHGLHSIAFPAISCGVYRFPLDQAATIAMREARIFEAEHDLPDEILFCCLGDAVAGAFEQAMRS